MRSDANLDERNESPDAARRAMARPRFDRAQFGDSAIADETPGFRQDGIYAQEYTPYPRDERQQNNQA